MKDLEGYNVNSINDYEDEYEEDIENAEEIDEEEIERELNATYELGDDDTVDEHFKSGSKDLDEEEQKKYYAYIQAHTGNSVLEKSRREKIEALSKAASAYMLIKATTTKSYSTSLIHRNAAKVKQTLDLNNMRDIDIDDMLKSPENLRKGVNEQLKNLYGTEKGFDAYISEMKTLADNLMTDENRSKDYKYLTKCIKDVANAEAGNMDDIISRNYKLMDSIEKYMKGKKSVRKTTVGVEHFNNALDALSILNKYNPMLADKVDTIVARINEVRNAEAADHRDHVEIGEFGAERSTAAKEARIEKQKEKKMERTMDKDKLKQKEMNHPKVLM